jgi:bifunctional pyridoxal-dependent enzyme with beta-cystathionase and maltose regulon repressor activities
MADVLTQQARVQLNAGSDYGAPDFLRMNTACPRSLLKQALQRLYDYLKDK